MLIFRLRILTRHGVHQLKFGINNLVQRINVRPIHLFCTLVSSRAIILRKHPYDRRCDLVGCWNYRQNHRCLLNGWNSLRACCCYGFHAVNGVHHEWANVTNNRHNLSCLSSDNTTDINKRLAKIVDLLLYLNLSLSYFLVFLVVSVFCLIKACYSLFFGFRACSAFCSYLLQCLFRICNFFLCSLQIFITPS